MHEQGLEADDMGLYGGVEQVRGHALDFFGQHPQIARPLGNDDAQHVFHGHAVGEGMAVGAKRTDPLGKRGVHDQVALGGHGLHAAMHMARGQVHAPHRFAFHREIEVDRLLQGDMHRPQRHGEGAAHGRFSLSFRMRSQRSVVQAPFIMMDRGTASLRMPASSSSSRKRRRGLG